MSEGVYEYTGVLDGVKVLLGVRDGVGVLLLVGTTKVGVKVGQVSGVAVAEAFWNASAKRATVVPVSGVINVAVPPASALPLFPPDGTVPSTVQVKLIGKAVGL